MRDQVNGMAEAYRVITESRSKEAKMLQLQRKSIAELEKDLRGLVATFNQLDQPQPDDLKEAQKMILGTNPFKRPL